MISLTGSIEGAAVLTAKLTAATEATLVAAERGVARTVLGGQSIVRGKARGRPGPRAITGDYNRSIVGDSERSGTRITGQIGTSAAQGRRLELGFVGTDSLGRNYQQPPFPHFGPSVPEVTALANEQIGAEIKAALE
jgi:hypothetical protein